MLTVAAWSRMPTEQMGREIEFHRDVPRVVSLKKKIDLQYDHMYVHICIS
jgi:hypothetical protein